MKSKNLKEFSNSHECFRGKKKAERHCCHSAGIVSVKGIRLPPGFSTSLRALQQQESLGNA